jgi:DNA-binding beta-propeller fold protein YncE
LISGFLVLTTLVGTLVVANKSGGTVSFIDLDTGREAARVEVGRAPHELAVSPDGRTVLVGEYGPEDAHGRTVAILDVASATVVGRIDVGPDSRPHSIAFLPGGSRAVVTLQNQDTIAVLDLASRTVARTIPTGGRESHMVRLSPDARRAYVTSRLGEGTLSIIDLEGDAPTRVLETGAGAEGLAVTPDGGEVWVLDREAGTVSIVDTSRGVVVERIPARMQSNRIAISGAGEAVVTNGTSGEAAVQYVNLWDVKTRTRKGRELPLKGGQPGEGAFGIWIQDRTAFIADTNGGRVLAYDLDAWGDEPRILISGLEKERPDGMGWSPVRVEVEAPTPR